MQRLCWQRTLVSITAMAVVPPLPPPTNLINQLKLIQNVNVNQCLIEWQLGKPSDLIRKCFLTRREMPDFVDFETHHIDFYVAHPLNRQRKHLHLNFTANRSWRFSQLYPLSEVPAQWELYFFRWLSSLIDGPYWKPAWVTTLQNISSHWEFLLFRPENPPIENVTPAALVQSALQTLLIVRALSPRGPTYECRQRISCFFSPHTIFYFFLLWILMFLLVSCVDG